jgi:drug/metabolite transporter (DMT)-like permease
MAFGSVYLIWGSTYLAIRYAIDSLPPLLMAGTRHVVAGVLLYLFARLRGASNPDWRSWRSSAIIGALLLLGGNGAVVWAEQRVPTGMAALLVATEPLWVMLLIWLGPRGSRLSGRVIVGLVCGFSGMVLLVRPFHMAGRHTLDVWGAAALVFASLSWATGSLLASRVKIAAPQMLGAGMQMISGGALLLFSGTIAGEWSRFSVSEVTLPSLAAVLYLIVFGSLIGFTSYTWILGVTSPSTASTYAYINPVVALALGWLFRGEAITPSIAAAAAIIIVGVIIIVTSQAGNPLRRSHIAARPSNQDGA